MGGVRNLAEVLEFFLRDVFIYLLPGASLLLLADVMFSTELDELLSRTVTLPPESGADWIAAIIASYLLGAALQAVGDGILIGAINHSGGWRRFYRWILPNIQSYADLEKDIMASPTFSALAPLVTRQTSADVTTMREMRDLAMSIAPQRINEVYRNMYTSALFLGASASLLVASIAIAAVIIIDEWLEWDSSLGGSDLYWLVATVPMALLLLDRRFRHYSISLRLPFYVALATMTGTERGAPDEHAQSR